MFSTVERWAELSRCERYFVSLQLRATDPRAKLFGHLGFLPGALRVAKTRCALAGIVHVVNDCVLALRADAGRHLVEPERLAHPPRHMVIRARGVPAHPVAAGDPVAIVGRTPAAEHDHAANALAHHWIGGRSELCGKAGPCVRGWRA